MRKQFASRVIIVTKQVEKRQLVSLKKLLRELLPNFAEETQLIKMTADTGPVYDQQCQAIYSALKEQICPTASADEQQLYTGYWLMADNLAHNADKLQIKVVSKS